MAQSDLTVRVGIDSSGSQAAAQELVRSFDAIRQAALRTAQALDGVDAAGKKSAPALGNAAGGVGDGLKKTGIEALKSREGFGKLQNVLVQVGLAGAGVGGTFGRLAGTLGTFALGGVTTLAVTAGVGALVFVYKKLTEESRKAEEAQKKLSASLQDAYRQYRQQSPTLRLFDEKTELEAARRAYNNVAREIARLQSGATLYGFVRQDSRGSDAPERQRRLAKATEELTLRAKELWIAQQRVLDTERDISKAATETERDEKRRAAEERFRLEDLRVRRLEAAGAKTAALARFDLDTQQQLFDAELAGWDSVTKAALAATRQAERYALATKLGLTGTAFRAARTPGEFASAIQGQANAERMALNDLLEPLDKALNLSTEYRRRLNAVWTDMVARSKELRGLPKEADVLDKVKAFDATQPQRGVSEEEWKSIQRQAEQFTAAFTTTLTSGIEAVINGGLKGFQGFFDGLVNMAVKAAAGIAAAFVVGRLGIKELFEKLKTPNGGIGLFGKGLTGTQQGVLGGMAGLAVGYGVGSIGNQSPGMGALTGGLSGAAAGLAFGPIGAAVGAVAGAIGGYISASQKAKDAAEALKQARKQFEDALTGWVSSGLSIDKQFVEALNKLTRDAQRLRDDLLATLDPKTLKTVSYKDSAGNQVIRDMAELERLALRDPKVAAFLQTLREINAAQARREELLRAEVALTKDSIAAGLDIRRKAVTGDLSGAALAQFDINAAREVFDALKAGWDEASLAALKSVQAQEREALVKRQAAEAADRLASLEARRLAASGDAAGAGSAELALRQAQELRAALTEGWSEEAIALLKTVQALEQAKLAREQEAQAILDTAQRRADELTLQSREARLGGRGLDADKVAAAAQAELALADARARLARGEITPEFYQRLATVIQGELTQSLADLEAQAAATAAALAEEVRRRAEDLDLREAIASGVAEDEIATLRLQMEQRREYDDAVKAGWSEAELARLKYIQGLEAEKLAVDLVADALDKAAAKANELKAFGDDITVRSLRAQGKDFEAEQYRLTLERDAALAKGQSLGGDEAFLQSIRDLFALEEQALAAKYAPREDVAGAAIKEAGAARTQTVATSYAAEGYLASANVYLREISYYTSIMAGVGSAPPAANTGAVNTGTGGTGSIVVNVTAPAGTDPQAWGEAVADQIDTALSRRATFRTGASGSVRTL